MNFVKMGIKVFYLSSFSFYKIIFQWLHNCQVLNKVIGIFEKAYAMQNIYFTLLCVCTPGNYR